MKYKKINFKEARNLLDNEPGCLLFDVRDEDEFITGHAAEAELFTLDTICKETAEEMIPKHDTPVIVYCRSGVRSGEAASILTEQLGYTKVYDLGSLVGWPYTKTV